MGISGVDDEPNGKHDFNHGWRFRHRARLKEYESGPTAGLAREIMKGFELTAAPDADVLNVAKAIVKIVDMPFDTRPFRMHIDPAEDGAEIVNGVAERVRAELLRNMGLGDLLKPVGQPAALANTVASSSSLR